MRLTRLAITNFRNITEGDLTPSARFNFLLGANGSGKTSVLEAIYYLGHGRSFRSHLNNRVIRYQQNELVVHGRLDNDSPIPLPVGIQKKRTGSSDVNVGGQHGQKIAQLAQLLPLQLITPEGFDLLLGGPKCRRAFIDWGVFHWESAFYDAWSRLKRLTRQRNALLKTVTDYREMRYWDDQLTLLAEKIDVWRVNYLATLTPKILEITQGFLPEFELTITYARGWDSNMPYSEVLTRQFERDKQLGYTANGPHKADLRIKIANILVEDVLSRGQLKLMVCALRLAQGLHFTEMTGKPCIYLIDDFASELDRERRALLAQRLKSTQSQVFISAISADHIHDIQDEDGKIFHVENGKITAE